MRSFIVVLLTLACLLLPGSRTLADRAPLTYQRVAEGQRSRYQDKDSCLIVVKNRRDFQSVVKAIEGKNFEYDADLLYFFHFAGSAEQGELASRSRIEKIWREGPVARIGTGVDSNIDIIHVEVKLEEGVVKPPFLDALSPWVCVAISKESLKEPLDEKTSVSLFETRIRYVRKPAQESFNLKD